MPCLLFVREGRREVMYFWNKFLKREKMDNGFQINIQLPSWLPFLPGESLDYKIDERK